MEANKSLSLLFVEDDDNCDDCDCKCDVDLLFDDGEERSELKTSGK